jgi:hypothetical protein
MGCQGIDNIHSLSHEPVAARKNKHRRSHAVTDFSTECYRAPQNNRHRRSSAMNQLDFENIFDHLTGISNNNDEPVSFHSVLEDSASVPTVSSCDSETSEESMQLEHDSLHTDDHSETTMDVLEMYLQELYSPKELSVLRSLTRQQLGLPVEIDI